MLPSGGGQGERLRFGGDIMQEFSSLGVGYEEKGPRN